MKLAGIFFSQFSINLRCKSVCSIINITHLNTDNVRIVKISPINERHTPTIVTTSRAILTPVGGEVPFSVLADIS